MAGRKTKYTPTTVKIFLDGIRTGLPMRWAAAHAGVNEDTILLWKHRYSEFSEQVALAESEFIGRNVRVIQSGADSGDSADAKWLLERRYPQEFGRLERLQIDVELRREAERIAIENGLDPNEVMVEAQRMLKAAK